MNQTQVKYVKQRIDDIYNTKRAAIKSKYIWVKKERTLEEKVALIQSGEFTIQSESAPYAKYAMDIRINFGDESNPNLKQEAEAYEKLRSARTKLLDELILGDSEAMLSALINFEKEEY